MALYLSRSGIYSVSQHQSWYLSNAQKSGSTTSLPSQDPLPLTPSLVDIQRICITPADELCELATANVSTPTDTLDHHHLVTLP